MSCLFQSLAQFVSDNHTDIRAKVCNYLDANGPVLDGVRTDEIFDGEYISTMRKGSTWGGGVEIQAACCIYNMTVVVSSTRHRDRSNRPIVFVPVQGMTLITAFLSWTGSHYTASRPILYA